MSLIAKEPPKRLLIIGAGGAGREVASWVKLGDEFGTSVYIGGFLDDNANVLANRQSDIAIIGTPLGFEYSENDCVLVAINSSMEKRVHIYNELKARRIQFYTFVAPNVIVGDRAMIEEGAIICPGAMISSDVLIKPNVFVNCSTQIGHDTTIGMHSTLMAHVNIGGECSVGKRTFFGTGAILSPKLTVCDDGKLSCGAVLTRSIRKPGVFFGNPAVLLK